MDPVSIGLGLAGLGLSLFGGDEQQVQAQKQQQMELEANRAQLQNFRNVQQAQARSVAGATAGGAQFGSGLQGGLAAASDEGGVNALGISQNLEIGRNIFGIDTDISQKRIQIAGLQSRSALLGGQAATGQGYQSLGGAAIKAGPIIGAAYKNISSNTGFGGPYV